MDASLKNFALAAAICAPLLAACTETPTTELDWGVNDHTPRHHAVARAELRDGPRTYVYQGNDVPQPTPRPDPAAEQPQRPDTGYAPAFAWPVSGTVIANFGATTNGERNDGINISTSMDAPIHASASGTVTYSGNELKDYGNLVLIKHDGGYVTAYAHADRLVVSRGEFVARGQVIGYSGSSGDVNSPQLHFEIRHDTQPVNPKLLLVARNS